MLLSYFVNFGLILSARPKFVFANCVLFADWSVNTRNNIQFILQWSHLPSVVLSSIVLGCLKHVACNAVFTLPPKHL